MDMEISQSRSSTKRSLSGLAYSPPPSPSPKRGGTQREIDKREQPVEEEGVVSGGGAREASPTATNQRTRKEKGALRGGAGRETTVDDGVGHRASRVRPPQKKEDATLALPGLQMNLVSMAAAVTVVEPELKWVSLWLRSRWAAVLAAVLAALLVVLLPVLLVEEQYQAALHGWAFLRNKLGLGYMGVATYTGQTTELSVTSGGLELMVLKPKASPEVRLEAKAALHQALEMKRQGKREKAQKLFLHALKMDPDYVDALTEFGLFSEEEKDIIQADYLYSKALTISPHNEKALVSRDRTLPLVEEIDQRYFSIIDSKVRKVLSIPKGNSALRRVMEESYYHHIYHTVAIEGNTLTLAEIRHIIETRYAVPGKSLEEQNEVIGMHAAMKYVNTTLVSRIGSVTLPDLLEIHRRVLGYVDPIEAGRFRTTQVFVGHHVPPHPRDVEKQMLEFVQWINSEDAMSLHPVEFAALAHYKLVYIHPFVDGNGRTSRLLMNLILMQAGYPPITIRKEQRAEYYNALEVANEGDVRPFIRLIAKCTETTLDMLLFATTEHSVGLPEAQDGSSTDCKQTISLKTRT